MSCIEPTYTSPSQYLKANIEEKKKVIKIFVQSFETGEQVSKQTNKRAISFYVPKLIESPNFFCRETSFEKVLEWLTRHANPFQMETLFNDETLKDRLALLKDKERDSLFCKLVKINTPIFNFLPHDFQEAHPDLQPKIEQIIDTLSLPCNAGN